MTSRHLSCGKRALNNIRGSDSFSATTRDASQSRVGCVPPSCVQTRTVHVAADRRLHVLSRLWETGGKGAATNMTTHHSLTPSNVCLFTSATEHLIHEATTTTTSTTSTSTDAAARIHQHARADGHALAAGARDVTASDDSGAFEACLWRVFSMHVRSVTRNNFPC